NIAILAQAQGLSADLIIGGYSFGGNVGLEMAMQLQRAGRPPRRLVLFDSIPPSAYHGTAKADSEFDDAIAMVVRQTTTGAPSADPDRAFAGIVEDDGSAAGVLYRDFTRLWRDNQRALAAYKPTEVLDCPITLFSTEQPLLAEEAVHLGIEAYEATAWQRYTAQPLEVIPVPGNHYSLFLEQASLQALARTLPGVLHQAGRR
ncbi:MAG: thioesterase domain-containing protein, partial [Mycobacterium sp.]